MTLARSTRAGAAAYALGLAGRSRDRLPVPWTDSAVMDDCAAFCSHVLWNGRPGPILWVDNFKTAGDGTYAAGAGDLAPWDVLLFDWEHNGVGNHVEFMVGDLGNGYVTTYGANGSDSRAAKYRTRPKSYILGRFRPRWSTPAATPQPATTSTIPTTNRREPVSYILQAPYKRGGEQYSVLIEPGTASFLDAERYNFWAGIKGGDGRPVYPTVQGNERSLALAREHRKTFTNGIKVR